LGSSTYLRAELYRDARIITYLALDRSSIQIVCSEPGSDDLIRIDKKHRLTVANVFAQRARERLSESGELPESPGYPMVDARSNEGVSDEEIAEAARLAFGRLGRDPFCEIRDLVEAAGLDPKCSTWSNL